MTNKEPERRCNAVLVYRTIDLDNGNNGDNNIARLYWIAERMGLFDKKSEFLIHLNEQVNSWAFV